MKNWTTSLCTGVGIVCVLTAGACSGDPAAQKQKYLENANRFVQEKKDSSAIIEFRNAIQIDPRFGPARVGLADTYARIGDRTRAVQEYIRAADVMGEDAAFQVRAGQFLLTTGRAKDALARADAALVRQPDNIDAHLLRGNALASDQQPEKALAEMTEAVRLDPSRSGSYVQLGFLHFVLGNTVEAETAFKKSVSLAPKAIEGQLALANFYLVTDRRAEAEEWFRRAWQLDPRDARTNRAMAQLSLVNGKTAEAETYVKQLSESSPDLNGKFALTDYYVGTGRAKESVDLLQKLAAQHPESVEVKLRLAQAYVADGDRSKAHSVIDEVLKRDPRNVSAQLFKGKLLAIEGHSGEALERARQAISVDPSSQDAQFLLGGLYAVNGDLAGAEKAFTEVLRLNPRAAAAQVELSRTQLAAGKTAAALQTAEQAAQSAPDNLNARLALVRSLLAAKESKRAESEVEKLLVAYPKVADVHVLSGVLAADRKDTAAARTAFEKALALDPESLEAVTGLVVLDLTARDFASAKERINGHVAPGMKPSPGMLLLAGRAYTTMGELEPAERALRQAIEADPTLLPAYGMLAQMYLKQKKLEQARRELDNLAERQSKPVGSLTLAGMILEAQGNVAEARKRYERVLAGNPRAGVAANNLAMLYVDAGENLDLALQFSQAAVAAMPEAPEALDTLGWIYYKKNLSALALPPLTRAAEKQPRNPIFHYHLGLAHAQAGDSVSAKSALEQALKLSPNFPGADEARRKLADLDVAL